MKDKVKEINEEYRENIEKKNKSDVDPNFNLHGSHITTHEQDEKLKQEKEDKAKLLIDSMQGDLKSYIDSQMSAIPTLVNNSINEAMQQIIPQIQQAQNPTTTDNGADKIAALSQLAPVIGQLLGRGEAAAPQSNIFQDMIMQSFVKMIQAKVDETVMGTYGVRVPPPSNVVTPNNQQVNPQSGLNIE